MSIRRAETKDIPKIIGMFMAMIEYIRMNCETDRFAEDENQLVGGVMLTVTQKMHDPGALVLVNERRIENIKKGEVTGFLVGRITTTEAFFQDTIVGDIQALFPIANGIADPLAKAFDEWAKTKGATARLGRVDVGSEAVKRIYEKRVKMRPLFTEYILPYEREMK